MEFTPNSAVQDVCIVADSISHRGHRLTTFQVRYWRGIHAEVMTHRMFSRNASSSRAIPVKTMLEQVRTNPAGPIHWGKNQPGMQARAELTGKELELGQGRWRDAAEDAALHAEAMMDLGLHKQVANRILEPFQFISVIITATNWENFFELRCHEDAQPEIQYLARWMRHEMETGDPQLLGPDDWHLPYVTTEEREIYNLATLKKLSTARNARVSFLNHDGTSPDIQKDIALHDRLVVAEPLHASPAEHLARPDNRTDMYHRNFQGWRSYRAELEEGH